jgi:hypothetical protein
MAPVTLYLTAFMEDVMHAKSALATLLFISSGAGMAEPLTWQFSYTGFYDVLARRFEPDRVLAGEFSGEDRNGDDVIDSGELESMLIYGERNYKGCQGEESPYHACGVGPFYFGPGNDLSFSLGEESHDRLRQEGGGHRIDTGDRDWSYRIVDGVEQPYRFYRWSVSTMLQVSVVPEPDNWTMLAGGVGVLLTLGALTNRSRRSGGVRRRRHA